MNVFTAKMELSGPISKWIYSGLLAIIIQKPLDGNKDIQESFSFLPSET